MATYLTKAILSSGYDCIIIIQCFNKINFLFLNAGAIEIHRGYEVESIDCDDYQPIDHIVFLVHGMGQLYHGEGGIIHSRKK